MLYIRIVLLGLWNAWFYTLSTVAITLCFPLLLVCLLREKWYRGIYFLARYFWSPFILFGMGFIPLIRHKSKIDYNKQYVFVANHLSMIDIMMIFMTIKKPAVFIGKSELDRLPLFATIYKRAAILVDRDSASSRKSVYYQAKHKIEIGFNIMLFQNRLNGGPIAFWRWHKPPCAQSRFTNESGNRICAFCFNHRLQIRHALADKALFALA